MLPYGYAVCIILSQFPPTWRKVINPLALAANEGEKVQEEIRKSLEKWIVGTLVVVTVVFTYITFFVYGFKRTTA